MLSTFISEGNKSTTKGISEKKIEMAEARYNTLGLYLMFRSNEILERETVFTGTHFTPFHPPTNYLHLYFIFLKTVSISLSRHKLHVLQCIMGYSSVNTMNILMQSNDL